MALPVPTDAGQVLVTGHSENVLSAELRFALVQYLGHPFVFDSRQHHPNEDIRLAGELGGLCLDRSPEFLKVCSGQRRLLIETLGTTLIGKLEQCEEVVGYVVGRNLFGKDYVVIDTVTVD